MRKFTTIGTTILLVSAVCWCTWPYFAVASLALADKKGEASSRRACDRIVAAGPRTIPHILSSIETHSPWARRYCYLPIALKELGNVSHRPLIQAIERQSDSRTRAYLISTLQTAFSDYRYLDLLIQDADNLSTFTLTHIGNEIRRDFPDAPPLLLQDRTLNPEFHTYWNEQKDHAAEVNFLTHSSAVLHESSSNNETKRHDQNPVPALPSN